MKAVDYRENKEGVKDMRIMFPNECWIRLIEDPNTNTDAYQFLQSHGELLYYLALESDDIWEEVDQLNSAGLKVGKEAVENSEDGYTITLEAEEAVGFPVIIIQPHESSYGFDCNKCFNPNVLGLQHVGVAIKDLHAAVVRFEKLFGIKAKDSQSQKQTSLHH